MIYIVTFTFNCVGFIKVLYQLNLGLLLMKMRLRTIRINFTKIQASYTVCEVTITHSLSEMRAVYFLN